MISRRDKLLVKPWEERRYEYHRQKVQSAVPVIDVGPPISHIHVSCKFKKQQKETERCDKIERDNLKLLQRLRSLMSTSRIDNTWTTAQPKVSIYEKKNNVAYKKHISQEFVEDKSRKGRCLACTPLKKVSVKIPEERVPWEPPKGQLSRKRSNSLPPKAEETFTNSKQTSSRKASSSSAGYRGVQPQLHKTKNQPKKNTPTIVLSRDDAELSVTFPQDTLIKLPNCDKRQIFMSTPCHCKARFF